MHPATTLIGLLIGVWGLVVTLRSRERVKGYFASDYLSWFRDGTKRDGLVITYRGEAVKQIGASEVTFWNGGNKTIRFEDFSKNHPLTLNVTGSIRVFELDVARKVPESLSVRLGSIPPLPEGDENPRRSVPIEFEFLEPNEGFRIKATHDGGSQAEINISGRLAGAGGVQRITIGGYAPLMRTRMEKFAFFQGLFLIGALGVYCINRILNADWVWYHGFGSFLIMYWIFLPGLVMAKVMPKGLH